MCYFLRSLLIFFILFRMAPSRENSVVESVLGLSEVDYIIIEFLSFTYKFRDKSTVFMFLQMGISQIMRSGQFYFTQKFSLS
jgi:hypothetical protein